MRVVKWLTGLLYQLSLFITRSWEVHFHPRQGKVTAGRLQERGGARARGGGRTEAGERLCPLVKNQTLSAYQELNKSDIESVSGVLDPRDLESPGPFLKTLQSRKGAIAAPERHYL